LAALFDRGLLTTWHLFLWKVKFHGDGLDFFVVASII